MADLSSLLRDLRRDGTLDRIGNNTLSQFGTRNRQRLGARILPVRQVPFNQFTEDQIRYRSVIANAGTRYSPVQLKGGALVGAFDVKLAEQDIGSQLTSRDFDALRRYLARGSSVEAMAALVNFIDTTIVQPLDDWNERAIWQAIVSATVQLRGDNEYTEDVAYSNPANHRAAAGGTWSSDAYDPMTDVFAMAQLLASKGFEVAEIYSSRNVMSILGGNEKIATRANSRLTVSPSGQLGSVIGRVTAAEINGILNADGLPPVTVYDLTYQTSTSTGRFLPSDVMVFIGRTGDSADVVVPGADDLEPLDNVIGYMAVGTAAGQDTPGRVIEVEAFSRKPPRVECEGWQTALPIITQPEAIAVITGIA